ncbi:MAG: CDP-6-deoxy-delta-3,4-glucoseen reductase [Thiohalocapsa sp.]|jgi:CDP-4-dehydro-6-deoxyglucose reductase|uniref:CDP-6-deoxy-delta-3,4-glucoseen reductase n=1 Tax=Thiohalocapsa sp. TaxID=2497641 RepID=UPI0025E85C38|nr:CDP-6-deoxy-delta-3,4-glucoseen reductase [Thiohalocapsa sp.]MCG6943616.1 CDP-6-deoxy-delta-3,4-glucoseen reductase [Thiohalocapsa sp.]
MSFIVRTEPAGHEFSVEPEQTLLEGAIAQRIGLPYGCRDGKCGSCTAQLVAGSVHYPSGKTAALEGQPADACLTCQAVPQSDVTLRVAELQTVADIEVRILPCRIVEKTRLNHDVIRLRLKLPEAQRLQFLAGQYLEFMLADGRKRAFSIANAPHDDALMELHVRRVPGGEFTDYVFDELVEKTVLRIQGPLGSFVLRDESTRPLLFVGGGTGFAPLKGLVEHAFHLGVERPMTLYWGVRAERDLYLPELPRQWAAEHANFSYVPVLSEPDHGWTGRRGYVHEAVLEDHPDIAGYDVYMSGPPVMVEAGRAAFEARGLALDHMFSDAFEYAADSPSYKG